MPDSKCLIAVIQKEQGVTLRLHRRQIRAAPNFEVGSKNPAHFRERDFWLLRTIMMPPCFL